VQTQKCVPIHFCCPHPLFPSPLFSPCIQQLTYMHACRCVCVVCVHICVHCWQDGVSLQGSNMDGNPLYGSVTCVYYFPAPRPKETSWTGLPFAGVYTCVYIRMYMHGCICMHACGCKYMNSFGSWRWTLSGGTDDMDMDIYNCRLKLYGGGCDVGGGMKYIYVCVWATVVTRMCVCWCVFFLFRCASITTQSSNSFLVAVHGLISISGSVYGLRDGIPEMGSDLWDLISESSQM